MTHTSLFRAAKLNPGVELEDWSPKQVGISSEEVRSSLIFDEDLLNNLLNFSFVASASMLTGTFVAFGFLLGSSRMLL